MRGVKVAVRVLLATVVLTLASGGVVAALAHHHGYRAYAVRTASMVPDLPPGDLLIDAPPQGPYVKGDVITFEVRTAPGMDPVVTHRVHAVHGDVITTKGDANRSPDPGTTTERDVVGQVISQIPKAGYVLVFLQQPGGLLGVLTALIALMLSWSLFFGSSGPEVSRQDVALPSS
jgi:signal peptidase